MTASKRTKPDPNDLALRRALGEALRSLRKEHKPKKLSQEGLALEAGLSRSYLSELERREHDPGLWALWRLKAALGISILRVVREIDLRYKPATKPQVNRLTRSKMTLSQTDRTTLVKLLKELRSLLKSDIDGAVGSDGEPDPDEPFLVKRVRKCRLMLQQAKDMIEKVR